MILFVKDSLTLQMLIHEIMKVCQVSADMMSIGAELDLHGAEGLLKMPLCKYQLHTPAFTNASIDLPGFEHPGGLRGPLRWDQTSRVGFRRRLPSPRPI